METVNVKKTSLEPSYPSYFMGSSLDDLMVKSTDMLRPDTEVKPLKNFKQVSGTQEWASQTVNFISGCSHDCKYCYAKSMAIRFGRNTPDNWKSEEVNFGKLSARQKQKDGYTMFPSSHDISPENLDYSLALMGRLIEIGNQLLIVTKPHLTVIKSICKRFSDDKEKILFRFTIGSCNTETLKFWELFAPSFEERLSSLKYAYSMGFKTSVSCEPALDTNTKELVYILLPYVTDAIWIGLPNRLRGILKLNGANDSVTLKCAEDLIRNQSNEWVMDLYDTFKSNPKIKWKDSIKKIIGIERPCEKGLDI